MIELTKEVVDSIIPQEVQTTPEAVVVTPVVAPVVTEATPELTDDAKANLEAYKKSLDQNTPSAIPADEEPKLDGLAPEVVTYINKLKEKSKSAAPVSNGLPEDIQARLNKLNELESNPVVTSFNDFLKTGGKVEDLFVSSGKDYDKVSEDEVLTDFFTTIYPTPEEQSKIPVAIKDFKEANKIQYQKDAALKGIRDGLKKSNPNKPGEVFTKVIGSHLTEYQKQNSVREAQQKSIQEQIKQSQVSLETSINTAKDFMGIPIAETEKSELLKLAMYHIPVKVKGDKKTLDTQEALQIAFKLKYFEKAQNAAQLKGYEDALKNFYRPSKDGASNAAASVAKGDSAVEVFAAANPIPKFDTNPAK